MEERDQILIERYLTGEATEAEQLEASQRMEADPVFRHQVGEYELAREALRLGQREALRERFRQRDVVLDKEKPDLATRDRRSYWWIGVTALVLVIVLLLWNFFLKPANRSLPVEIDSTDSPISNEEFTGEDSASIQMQEEKIKGASEKEDRDRSNPREDAKQNMGGELFAAYYEPYSDPMMDPTTRGDSEPTLLDQFRKAYWEERYADVPALFQKLDATHQQNDNYRFQLANALMEIERVVEAIPVLESVVQHNRSRFTTEANFYLGLAYLHQENTGAAKKWLNAYISLEKAKQKDRAREILKLLEKL